MNKIKTIIGLLVAGVITNSLHAQTNGIMGLAQTNAPVTNPPPAVTGLGSPLAGLQSYLTVNDPSFNGWSTNKFLLTQTAVFQNVNGTPGASSEGNVLGLEIPIHKWSVHMESRTRFEQLFGDVHSQAMGVGYDYVVHQIRLSAGLDGDYAFAGNRLQAVPFIELIKMPTTLYGLAPVIRYSYPITKAPGAGRIEVGMGLSF